jgi:hypothetical protein
LVGPIDKRNRGEFKLGRIRHIFGNYMFNKSYITILTGLASMIFACFIFYFDTRSFIAFALFAIGFILVGVGILLGFARMVSDNKE